MIESPKIFRLAIHDEPDTLRLIYADQAQIIDGDLRLASCYELSAPLRRTILQVRQAILDSQQENGFFTCAQETTPQSIAEFLLCSYWLGLRDKRSLEAIFSNCVDRLIASQEPNGRWPADFSDGDSFSSTLMVYLALKLSGVSISDPTMVSARKSLPQSSDFQQLQGVARGYLSLFGEATFPKNSGRCECSFSLNEKLHWQALMQQNVHRQLAPAESLVELHGLWRSQEKAWLPENLQGKILKSFHAIRRNVKNRSRFYSDPKSASMKGSSSKSYREKFYSVMASDGPVEESIHATELQELIERLKNGKDSLDAVLTSDVSIQVECLESLLLSGLAVDSSAINNAARTLFEASLHDQSHLFSTAALRAACLVRESHLPDESLPPSIQVISDKGTGQDCTEDKSWIALLVSSIPDYMRRLLASQSRKGSWRDCAVATAEAVLALSLAGMDLSHKRMVAAIRFLRKAQLPDGSWQSGEEGNRITVTSKAIVAAKSIGLGPNDPMIVRGARWLIANQQPGGSWLDNTAEAISPVADEGLTSLRHTALVLSALIDCGLEKDSSVSLGMDFLLETDLFQEVPGVPEELPLPLSQLCPILRALCRWAVVEDNGGEGPVSMSSSLGLLSPYD